MAKQPKPKLAGNMKPVIKVTNEVAYTPNRPKPAMGFPTTPERDSTMKNKVMKGAMAAKAIATGMKEGVEEAASAMMAKKKKG